MKKHTGWLGLILLCLFLSQCANKEHEKIVGIWQLEQMNINGTNMDGHSLGEWLWEFNEDGGYMTNVGGETEKGWYKLKDKELKIKITTVENREEQIYLVNLLDSAHLELTSSGDKNKATIRFLKWKERIGEEED